jgi:cysteinyl-tRNA synthetase
VKGDNPEQELWDMVLGEISAGYEQRLFVNDDYYDIVGSDEAVAELRKEGMEAFKKAHDIEKITSMGYYNDEWSGYMSDQTDYRIQESKPRKKPEPTEAVKKLLEQVNKITDDGIKELRHYTETLEDSSDTANCFAKVYDVVKNFANRFGAAVDPEPAKPTVEQIKAAVLRYLDGKFETAEVVDDYRKVVTDGLQASYTTKEELRADVERIFKEGEDFFSEGK